MCEQLLANPLIESFEIEVEGKTRDPAEGCSPGLSRLERRPRRGLGARRARRGCAARLARGRGAARETGAVVLPGGFSYGDYLRCGAIARSAAIMGAVRAFAADGGPVLGICNGFQILCEAGLLPGVLRRNRQLEFVCRDVAIAVERADTLFTRRCEAGQDADDPGEARRGLVVRGRRAVRRAGGLGSARASLRRGLQRLGRRRGGRVRRGRHRLRPDAASGACRRSAARLGRRRAAARRARRRGTRARARRRPTR